MRNYVDEDGFTMVVRGGRNAPAKQEQAQAVLERKRMEQEEKRKANIGFYRFQAREGKKEEVKRLLEKFERDKERVKERKERRKFKVSFSFLFFFFFLFIYFFFSFFSCTFWAQASQGGVWGSRFKLNYSATGAGYCVCILPRIASYNFF